MNLISDPWLPVLRQDGSRENIAPWQVAEADNPVIDINAPRADFRGALYQWLIGLLQATSAPSDVKEWLAVWKQGPDVTALQEKFAVLADGFELFNKDGPAFLQDHELPDGESKGIATLLIEAPGGKTIKDNLDHFIKRDTVNQLCASCAATALFTLQTNAPAGGKGYRTGLRGGGPLTTLVMPHDGAATLWQKLWLNVLDLDVAPELSPPPALLDADVFPWLGPTRLSDKKGSEVLPGQVHALQMYWGMPRRIRLQSTDTPCRCDLCGKSSDIAVNGFRTTNYGVNYDGGWLHPLTPYRHDPKKQKLPLSSKGQQGGIGYRHWLGLTMQDRETGDTSATVTRSYMEKRARMIKERGAARLWCFGYDMDNMKARCWYDSQLPLFQLEPRQRQRLLDDAGELINAAKIAASLLRKYTKEAWFRRPSDVKGDMSYIDTEFWQRTEADFYRLLHQLANVPDDVTHSPEVCQDWLKVLGYNLFDAFDRWTLEANPEELDIKRIVMARNTLGKKFYAAKAIKHMKLRAQQTEEVE